VSDREIEWAALMRAANAGDAAAYEKLLRDLARALRAAARTGLLRAGRSAADAEDVVQDTLLAIHLKRHTWDAAQPLGPWVRAIARNKLIDALRKRRSGAQIPIDDLIDVLPAEDAEPQAPARDVERHVGALPDRQRDVVRAVAVEGASSQEAAATLGMSEGAVRVALHRGLTTLAARLRQ
jgi:RNA polymerase sigma-70 factor (ECF subfamily)